MSSVSSLAPGLANDNALLDEKKAAALPVYACAQVILGEETGTLASHQVWINPPLAKQLFPNELESQLTATPHYIRITNRVYCIVLLAIGGVEQPSVVIKPAQQKDAVISNSSVLIGTFDSQTGPVGSLDSLEVHLHSNHDGQEEHLIVTPHLVTKEQMTRKMKSLCIHLILRSQQTLPAILDEQKSFSAVVHFNKSDFSASVPASCREFGQITQETRIKFIYNTAQVFMVKEAVTKADHVLFHVTVDDKVNEHVHCHHPVREEESLVLDQAGLIKHFTKLLGERHISLGQTFVFQYKGHKISLYSERINQQSLGLHSLNAETELMAYRLANAQIEFKINSPNVLLGQNEPIAPEQFHIRVLRRIATASTLDKDGPAWISMEDLQKELKEKIAINGQVLKISLPDGDYLIAPTFTPPASEVIVPHQFYQLGSDEFAVGTNNELIVIPTSKRRPLQTLTVTVRPKSQAAPSGLFHTPDEAEATNTIEVDSQELTDMIAKLTYPIYEKAAITVTVKGVRIPLEVTSMEAKDDDASSSSVAKSEAWLGTVSSKIAVKVYNDPDNTGIALRRKDDPVPDRAALLKELKSSLGGLDHVFEEICNIITQSRGGMVEEAKKRGIQPVRGLLLYGPPGTGKTSSARLIGKLLNCKPANINRISGTDVLNKWVGGTEDRIRKLFEPAHRDWQLHKENSDLHLLMIDELDGLLPDRNNDRLPPHAKGFVNAFLAKMDGFDQMNNLFVIGLTNRLDDIDPAARRHGRFSKKIEVGLPTEEGRKEIFHIYTKVIKDNGLLSDNIDYQLLAKYTKKASGAEIRGVVEEAASLSLDRLEKLNLSKEEMTAHPARMVTMGDFITTLIHKKYMTIEMHPDRPRSAWSLFTH
jgi:ATP-dependent 26S proteasome regulatory subunit